MSKKSRPHVRLSDDDLSAICRMPPLSHWPDRSKKYDPMDSESAAWMVEALSRSPTFREAVFEAAREYGLIEFLPQSKVWKGTA